MIIMFRIQNLRFILIFGSFIWGCAEAKKDCVLPQKTTCKCNLTGNDEVDVESAASTNDALVASVSAMSAFLLSGCGFALYSLLKDRCNTPRQTTDTTSLFQKRNRRRFGSVPSSETPTNVYRSGISDDVNHRTTKRIGSAESYGKGAPLSDWS